MKSNKKSLSLLPRKAAFVAGFMMLTMSSQAFAVCELPGVPQAAAGVAATGNATALGTAHATTIATSQLTLTTALQAPVSLAFEDLQSSVFSRMNTFWDDWQTALKGMTAQLSAGSIDQTRQLASLDDSKNTVGGVIATQKEEYKAKKIYQPTEQSCTFDTAAHSAGSGARRSKAVSSALATDLTRLGTNKKGSIGAQGPAPVQRERWKTYAATFCDPNANSKDSGCKTATKNMGADILPSKTIFMHDTIDMKNEDTRTAMQELVMNVSGYKIPDPITTGDLKKAEGRQQRSSNRDYLTQMDAVTATINGVIAEKAPGEKSTEIQALRMKQGLPACSGTASAISCASDTPSAYEVRKARLEEVRDPGFYVGLGEGDNATLKKEVMLQALNLSMLYSVIEKTEKISNVWSVETGNMLQKIDNSRGNGSKYMPKGQ